MLGGQSQWRRRTPQGEDDRSSTRSRGFVNDRWTLCRTKAASCRLTRSVQAVSGSREAFDDAFRKEFDKHFASLFRYLDRLTGDPDLAADVAQEAFIRLYRRGSLPTQTGSWLAVVARNLFWNARSKSRRRRRLLATQRVRETMADPNPSLATGLEEVRRRRSARRALDRLPERERELLLLRYEGFSYREIAEILELNEASVGTLLVRAKQAFRNAIEGWNGAP